MVLLPKQEEFVFDLTTPQIAFIAGYGAGKTYAAVVKAIFLSGYNPGTAGMLVSPTYAMMRDTTRRTFFEILETENIGFTFRATENIIILNETGSQVWFRSADDPTKLKGSNLAWVGIDEPALTSYETYNITLARLRDNKAKTTQLFITGTHEGYSWVYDVFETESKDKKLIRSATDENIFVSQNYINSLYDNYDEKLIKQYIKGYAALINSGQVYYSFERDKNITDKIYDQEYHINLCVDFNVDPLCWVVVQTINNVDYVINEIILRNSNTEYAAKYFREKYPHADTIVYGDYSGTFRHTSSPTTDYDIIREIINPVDIRVQPDPPVINRINSVNSRLKNSRGIRKLFINKDCKLMIKDLERVIYKPGKREIDKSQLDLTHLSDALGYYIEYEYSLKGKPKISTGKML